MEFKIQKRKKCGIIGVKKFAASFALRNGNKSFFSLRKTEVQIHRDCYKVGGGGNSAGCRWGNNWGNRERGSGHEKRKKGVNLHDAGRSRISSQKRGRERRAGSYGE
jgi:hypothetical protein